MLPILEAAELPSPQVRDFFESQGCVLIKNVYPKPPLNQLKSHLDKYYKAAEMAFDRGDMAPEIDQGWYQYGHLPPDVLNLDLKAMAQPLLPVLHLLMPRAYLIVQNSLPRKQSPHKPEQQVPYHQDAEFIGPLPLALNAWIPLDPCGQKAPGLEILRQRLERFVLPAIPLKRSQYRQRESLYFDPGLLWRPQMAPGDVLFFHHYSVHRTHLTSHMTQSRLSIEIRCSEKPSEINSSPLETLF